MKVTNELGNKILNCVDKKYEADLKMITSETQRVKEERTQHYIGMAKKAVELQPELLPLFEKLSGSYAGGLEESVRRVYTGYLATTDSRILELNNQEKELRTKKKNEIENIKIKISYGKSFDDIKDVFSEYGFDF